VQTSPSNTALSSNSNNNMNDIVSNADIPPMPQISADDLIAVTSKSMESEYDEHGSGLIKQMTTFGLDVHEGFDEQIGKLASMESMYSNDHQEGDDGGASTVTTPKVGADIKGNEFNMKIDVGKDVERIDSEELYDNPEPRSAVVTPTSDFAE